MPGHPIKCEHESEKQDGRPKSGTFRQSVKQTIFLKFKVIYVTKYESVHRETESRGEEQNKGFVSLTVFGIWLSVCLVESVPWLALLFLPVLLCLVYFACERST